MNPTWEDIAMMETFLAALSPFSELTDVMCGEKAVTISSVYPLLMHIKKVCNDKEAAKDLPDEAHVEIFTSIRKAIQDYISERYVSNKKQSLVTCVVESVGMLSPF